MTFPVVQNKEVISLLDKVKCLYDAIAQKERQPKREKSLLFLLEELTKIGGCLISVGEEQGLQYPIYWILVRVETISTAILD